jgi:hypothetical protein
MAQTTKGDGSETVEGSVLAVTWLHSMGVK